MATSNADDNMMETVMPSSQTDACERAREAVRAAIAGGMMQLFVEIDTSNGDETYTLLKRSLGVAREVARGVGRGGTTVIALPDAGAAALAKRDWGSEGGIRVVGLESAKVADDVDAVVVVVPRGADVDELRRVAADAEEMDAAVVVVNADLVDMGVTGLSLQARQLRSELLDGFEYGFVLRVCAWGVLLREWPRRWGAWVDDGEGGFRYAKGFDRRPGPDEIDGVMKESGGTGEGFVAKIARFLSRYVKG